MSFLKYYSPLFSLPVSSVSSSTAFVSAFSSAFSPSADTDSCFLDEEDLNALVNDPTKKNDPNVKQIQSLLQRMQNR